MIERLRDWIADRWLWILSTLVVLVGLILGRRAERKTSAAAEKVAKAGRTIERAKAHAERADETLRKRREERSQDESEAEDDSDPRAIRARIARINGRLRDARGD